MRGGALGVWASGRKKSSRRRCYRMGPIGPIGRMGQFPISPISHMSPIHLQRTAHAATRRANRPNATSFTAERWQTLGPARQLIGDS